MASRPEPLARPAAQPGPGLPQTPNLPPARAWTPGLFRLVRAGLSCGSAGLALLVSTAGCGSPAYYSQAIRGHLQIMADRTPCQRLIEDPKVSADLKGSLVTARRLCEFAQHELSLEANGHFQHYADIGRPFVVWNLYAARELSLEAKTWGYPVVGRLDYRGYFDESAARRYARRLEEQGWETYIEGATAYSTLGWFRDPLLNTFLRFEEAAVAETLFHELAHQRVFAPGDTDFNEAYATVVGREGTRRWMRSRGDTGALRTWEESLELEEHYVATALAARNRLQCLYSQYSGPHEPPGGEDTVRARKRDILNRLATDLASLLGNDMPSGEEWNHARLNSLATYYELVPAFDALLAAHGGDLCAFHEAVGRIAHLPASERVPALQSQAH